MNTLTSNNKQENDMIVDGIITNSDYIKYYYDTRSEEDYKLPEFVTNYFHSQSRKHIIEYKKNENKREKCFSWKKPYDIDFSPKNQFYESKIFYYYKNDY